MSYISVCLAANGKNSPGSWFFPTLCGGAVMTIEEMKERKRELGYSYEQLAKLAGIPCSTVQKIFGGTTRSPRRSTIKSLEKILQPSAVEKIHTAMEDIEPDRRGNPLE